MTSRVINGERKVRMAMPYNMPMLVTRDPRDYDPEPLFIFSLTKFEIKDGNVRWAMETPTGEILEGSLGEKEITTVNGWGKIKVVLAMPIVIHKQPPTLAPDFMISIPKDLRVSTLATLKKRFGTDNRFFK